MRAVEMDMVEGRRGYLTLVLMALVLVAGLWPQPGAAHPFGPRFYSLRNELAVRDGELLAVVALEIPTPRVLREFGQLYAHLEEIGPQQDQEFRELQWERLREGLSIEIDGQAVAGQWVPADSPLNGKGGEEFFIYMVQFQPAAPISMAGPELTVVIDDQSFSGLPMYYSGYAEADGVWSVSHNSVEALIGDAASRADVAADPEGWTRDDAARRLEVRFRRAP